MAVLSGFTKYLAKRLSKGSTRKLIAGWWYSILAISFFLGVMTFYIVPTRETAEAFTSCWSSVILVSLCVGGTMVMRKFHNSFSTGLFLGGVVGGAFFFFLLFILFVGFAIERNNVGANSFEDNLQATICLVQSILLGSFAMMLGAHRTEIIDRNANLNQNRTSRVGNNGGSNYDPPSVS
mmetsp:Transcript_14393/g.21813  ORF Transcript_14393/g.21813 Transcript_14393/m.21813 type:complete len:180 (+) Transcript_14393:150-689(+)